MPPEETISKIFRVALFIFATTFGIGLYALIGAPVLRINYNGYAEKIIGKVASVGAGTLNALPLPNLVPQKGPIMHELTVAANDLPMIKSIILDDAFGKEGTREIVFTKKGTALTGRALIEHFANGNISEDLGHLLLDQRYFVSRTKDLRGALLISILNEEGVYANMLPAEPLLAESMMHLVHPGMSIGEARMLTQIRFVSLTVGGIGVRAITSSGNEPILIWGIHKDLLIIAGDKESFIDAMKNDPR